MPITLGHQFLEYWLNYFMFIFFRPLCVLNSRFHGRLAKADCTTPCKICSQAFKTHFWRQVMFSRIFWEGHFFKFQSNLFLWFEFFGSFFFLDKWTFFCLSFGSLWSTFWFFRRLIKQQFFNFFTFNLHGLVSLQSKVANKVSGILGFHYLSNHSKYDGSVMHHLYIISIEHR